MPIRLEQELYRAAILTFEELSFMLPADTLNERQRAATPSARASISFAGPFVGNLVVTAHGDLLPRISANMLGQDKPPALSEQLDALREISNVVCGNLLPSLAGSDAIFDISPPAVANPVGPALQVEKAAEVEIGLEEGRFHFALALVGYKSSEEHTE
jgi:CheY-specific phosphatase CheX